MKIQHDNERDWPLDFHFFSENYEDEIGESNCSFDYQPDYVTARIKDVSLTRLIPANDNLVDFLHWEWSRMI